MEVFLRPCAEIMLLVGVLQMLAPVWKVNPAWQQAQHMALTVTVKFWSFNVIMSFSCFSKCQMGPIARVLWTYTQPPLRGNRSSPVISFSRLAKLTPEEHPKCFFFFLPVSTLRSSGTRHVTPWSPKSSFWIQPARAASSIRTESSTGKLLQQRPKAWRCGSECGKQTEENSQHWWRERKSPIGTRQKSRSSDLEGFRQSRGVSRRRVESVREGCDCGTSGRADWISGRLAV